MELRPCTRIIFIYSLFFILAQSVHAEDILIFSTAPTQPPAVTVQLYKPLVERLSAATGKRIVLKPARNFLEYTRGIQKGSYDILFDGPHFVGWRMARSGHKVIARLPGRIVFTIIAREDAGITDYSQLAGKKVCAFASPNLLTLGFMNLFPRAASQPIMVRVKSFKGALDCVKSGKGVAAVMRDKFWDKRSVEEKQNLQLLYTANHAFPHRAFSVSKRVDARARKAILQTLLKEGAEAPGSEILKRFRSKSFLLARPQEYKGLGALLKPVWGFRHAQ